MPFFTEPHPTTRTASFIASGRGGSGNFLRSPITTTPDTASGPASLFHTGLPRTCTKVLSGRGGAGNIKLAAAGRPVTDYDEEVESRKAAERDGVVHVGRGGAGNLTRRTTEVEGEKLQRLASGASSKSERLIRRVSSAFAR